MSHYPSDDTKRSTERESNCNTHGYLPIQHKSQLQFEIIRYTPTPSSLHRFVLANLVLMTTARLDSPGRLLRSRSASPSGRSTGRSTGSWYTDSGPKGIPHDHCLSLGRGGGRSMGRGAWDRSSAGPGSDEKPGEWVTISTFNLYRLKIE